VETHFSLPHALNGFRFRENIVADRADLVGAGARFHASRGLDPEAFRALGDLRVEGATGDFDFARAMLELTLSRALAGNVQGSLTAAGGTSAGDVPTQRLWFLGGVHTIRGQPLAAAAGDAFWMGRGEIGYAVPVVKPSIFYDLGWAGSRRDWRSPGNPISGAGIGLSILDGMFRFDLAKGLRPNRGVRLDLTLEARF
jgi:hemolysin activation/secretion protein